MANHLTPEELSQELGIDRTEVIRVCVEEGIPIYRARSTRRSSRRIWKHSGRFRPAINCPSRALSPYKVR